MTGLEIAQAILTATALIRALGELLQMQQQGVDPEQVTQKEAQIQTLEAEVLALCRANRKESDT